jgi:hypothetical protein
LPALLARTRTFFFMADPSAAALCGDQLRDAALGQVQQGVSSARRKRRAFGGALHFDMPPEAVITTFMSVSQAESSG